MAGIALESDRRREALRTNLWFVPTVEVLAACGLFVLTYLLDRAADRGAFAVPSWVIGGTPDTARQVLTAIAAAIMTVVGVVFSITILALTLASTQFGPRMLRTFIRDRGTRVTLGTFVASFVYAIAAAFSPTRPVIYTASALEMFAQGLGTAGLLAFLTSCCRRENAATEYALLSALFAFSRELAGALSGFGAERVGYDGFFFFTGLLALPALALLPWLRPQLLARDQIASSLSKNDR